VAQHDLIGLADNEVLRRAISDAVRGRRFSSSVVLHGRSVGRPLIACVQLHEGNLAGTFAHSAAVALVEEQETVHAPRAETVRQMFGLTLVEAEISLALAEVRRQKK
jgi:hypothetical protein